MKRKWNQLLLLSWAVMHLAACNNQHKADYREFEQFYDKFMQDSSFQVKHINFPLEGLPDNAGEYEGDLSNFRWTADTWRMHRPIDFTKTKMKQEFQTLGEELIIENIVDQNYGYGMVRRWAKLGGEWSLIYYVGMNPISQ